MKSFLPVNTNFRLRFRSEAIQPPATFAATLAHTRPHLRTRTRTCWRYCSGTAARASAASHIRLVWGEG
eukprot:365370-Chlamydomonas_euryale.AAC.5